MHLQYVFASVFLLLTLGLRCAVQKELPPFTAIKNCGPFSLAIAPSDGGIDYAVDIDAAADVEKVIGYEVKEEELIITASGTVVVTEPVIFVVTLPPGKLKRVENYGSATILVDTGFDVDSVSFSSTEGKMLATGISATDVSVQANGFSSVEMGGAIEAASLTASDGAKIVVNGVKASAEVLGKDMTAFYITGSPGKVISGTVYDFAKVYADESKCEVESSGVLSTTCQPIESTAVPKVEFKWTSSLQFSGSKTCAADRVGYTSGTVTVTTVDPEGGQKVETIETEPEEIPELFEIDPDDPFAMASHKPSTSSSSPPVAVSVQTETVASVSAEVAAVSSETPSPEPAPKKSPKIVV